MDYFLVLKRTQPPSLGGMRVSLGLETSACKGSPQRGRWSRLGEAWPQQLQGGSKVTTCHCQKLTCHCQKLSQSTILRSPGSAAWGLTSPGAQYSYRRERAKQASLPAAGTWRRPKPSASSARTRPNCLCGWMGRQAAGSELKRADLDSRPRSAPKPPGIAPSASRLRQLSFSSQSAG